MEKGFQSNLPPLKPVFGVSLNDLYVRDGTAVPFLVYQCFQAVELFGLDMEGIYRLSGSANHISHMKAVFDNGEFETRPLRQVPISNLNQIPHKSTLPTPRTSTTMSTVLQDSRSNFSETFPILCLLPSITLSLLTQLVSDMPSCRMETEILPWNNRHRR